MRWKSVNKSAPENQAQTTNDKLLLLKPKMHFIFYHVPFVFILHFCFCTSLWSNYMLVFSTSPSAIFIEVFILAGSPQTNCILKGPLFLLTFTYLRQYEKKYSLFLGGGKWHCHKRKSWLPMRVTAYHKNPPPPV